MRHSTHALSLAHREYLAKASTPTDVQGIVEMLGSRAFALEEDVVDPNML